MTRPLTMSPHRAIDLAEAARALADLDPDGIALRYAPDGRIAAALTRADLDRHARAVAAALQAAGIAPGDRVLLVTGPGTEFAAGFHGCLYAGACAVPCPPPRSARHRGRLASVAADAGAAAVLTTGGVRPILDRPEAGTEPDAIPALDVPILHIEDAADPGAWRPCDVRPGAPAFIQYTSGSTGAPKGVVITHENAVANIEMIVRAIGYGELDVGPSTVSWLPVHHDMGLVGCLLTPLFGGGTATVLPPEAFLQDPMCWLRLIGESGGPVSSAAPNFALDMCVDRLAPDRLDGLRLDHWHALICGAEPLRAATMDRFVRHMRPLGFRPERLLPAYGLAEATLLVTIDGHGPRTLRAGAADLEQGRLTAEPAGRHVDLVSCGAPPDGSHVAIVAPETGVRCPDGVVGEIWASGPHVTRGYWGGKPGPHAVLADDDEDRTWLRTGDLGVLRDGALYVTGRRKDLIILDGRNLHPQDVERAAERDSPAARPGLSAAFSVPVDGVERLVVVRALDPRIRTADGEAVAAAAERVRRAIIAELEVEPHAVVLVRAGEIKLTTSGKVRRREIRERYLSGRLRAVHVHSLAAEPAGDRSPGREALLRLAAGARPGAVEAWLRERAAALAHVAAWEIDPDLPLPACGLDSRRIALLRADILDATGVAVPARADSLRAVADAVVAGLDRPPRADPAALVPAPRDRHEPFPLTDMQHAYLVGRGPGQEYGGVAAHAYLEIDADGLDLARLEAAWRRVVGRHDMLRAVVTADGRQRVLPPPGSDAFDRFDLRGIPPEEARAVLDHEVASPYEGPMHRIAVSRLPDGGVRLHLGMDLLVADLWSLYVLSREWRLLYDDPDADLPEPDLGFRDWAIAERSPRPEDVRYWRDRVPQLPPAPQLPVTAWRPGEPARFTRRRHRIEPAPWKRLTEAARAHGVTPSAVLLAAYGTVLAAWSRSPRFTVNVTLFNRPAAHPGLANVVGDFTSVDPLEVDCAGPGRFADLALAVQRRLWEDLEHASYSGLQVMRDLARRDGATGRAILPCVFTSGLGLGDGEPPFGWLGRLVHGISQTPQVVLDHQVFEDGDGALLVWDAAGDHFPPGVLDATFAAYRDLLEALAAGGGRWDLPPRVPLPADQAEARARVNATAGPVPDGTLPDAVFARAAERPAAPAVIAADRTLAYGELAERADGLAADLADAGIGRGDVVAVSMPKGWRQIVAVLAVTRIGAAYLPVDPGLPEDRRRWLVDTAGAALVLRDVPDARTARSLSADDPPQPGDLAYILYTSGSTGTPKGVAVNHTAALNTCVDVAERLNLGPDDRVLGVSSLSFDLSVFDIFGVLGAGGALVLPDPERRADPAHWADLVYAHGVTLWNSVPALMELLADHIEHAGSKEPPLRHVLLSGDWIPVSLPDRLRALAPDAQVISLGGATEAGIWSIAHPIDQVDLESESIPYGTPLRNQWFEVLNERLEPCPTWVTGELYIGGTGLAEGYWRDPERTEAQFIVHPGTGHRLYRTGDLGCYLPDGAIRFLGRHDHQVKVGGHRVELGEIEHTLRAAPGVGEAVVIAHGDRHRRRLAGFVTRAMAAPVALPGEEEAALLDGDLDGVLLDPVERREFALARPGLRAVPGAEMIALPEVEAAPRRSSHRRFTAGPVALDALSRLLEGLRDGDRHAYGSAGGLYPVQVYLDVAEGGVADLPGGAYYHRADGHRLAPLSREAVPARPGFTSVNAALAAGAPFAIYLVAQSRAIRPLYGRLWRDFSLIEAGLIAQLLETAAPPAGLGLCQAGDARLTDAMRARFALDDGHELLHALVGGVPDTAPAPPGGPTRATLRRWLAERLPSALVPPTIVVLDRLPLTPIGKVDRRELARLAGEAAAAGEAPVPPATGLESAIVAEVAAELGLDGTGEHGGAHAAEPARISVTDGFFDLGLDSAMITRICARLRARLADMGAPGADLPLPLMFEAPSIRALAARLDGAADPAAAARAGRSRGAARRAARNPARNRRPAGAQREDGTR
ncbi:amino acid adenylation domain-containing protein [Actinomadura soli]|uniref:Phenyloxazoline synthase MbtB n=1 Tax=Actinomadura soli TaxID=2508997 RepID=A0A5C4J9Z1_9ACTN|nr:non-ribosomal peptide synthetase [Actinomadura soli]TMQ97408.1 amino acid adenylation domain-containing protein [Actinomadura soli]